MRRDDKISAKGQMFSGDLHVPGKDHTPVSRCPLTIEGDVGGVWWAAKKRRHMFIHGYLERHLWILQQNL